VLDIISNCEPITATILVKVVRANVDRMTLGFRKISIVHPVISGCQRIKAMLWVTLVLASVCVRPEEFLSADQGNGNDQSQWMIAGWRVSNGFRRCVDLLAVGGDCETSSDEFISAVRPML
jgi:hypothetical protein